MLQPFLPALSITVCRLMLLLVIGLGLSGCTTVLVESARRIKEDRVADEQFSDTKISASAMSTLMDADKNYLLDVNVDVWEGRLLLTGTVHSASARKEVAQAIRADKRVRRVYDELQIVSIEELQRRRDSVKTRSPNRKEGADRVINDYWIETKIAAQLMAAADVSSVNFRWRAVRNVVYVIGRSRSQTEVSAALAIIRAIEGVVQVKSFVEIKPA